MGKTNKQVVNKLLFRLSEILTKRGSLTEPEKQAAGELIDELNVLISQKLMTGAIQ